MSQLATMEQSQTALEIRAQVNRIQEVMEAVMQDGQHYGVVPGCGNKPTLLKPGAEKLMMTFRLAVDPEVEDLGDPFTRRYRVKTRVTSQLNGVFLGTGVGECASDEEKYAWREAVCQAEYDATDPSLRRQKWKKGVSEPINQVHTNPADVANTILKMAKKRSLVDAILTVTAASDIFSQDYEDLPEELRDGNGQPLQKIAKKKKAVPSNELCVPNYGPDPGKPFSEVSTEHLKVYFDGAERSIKDPKKANFLKQNEKMRDALKAEIAKREAPAKESAPAQPSQDSTPADSKPTQQDLDAAWLSKVLDCEDWLRGTLAGKGSLRSIRAGFKLDDGAYPMLPDDQANYLADLTRTVNMMQAKQ